MKRLQEVMLMSDDYDDYDELDDLGDVEVNQGASYYEDEELDPDELSAIDEDDRDASYYEYMWGGPEDEDLEAWEQGTIQDDLGGEELEADEYSYRPPTPPPPAPRPRGEVMDAGTRLRQSQWFYDDTGYYSYILLNVPEAQFKQIQQVLRERGLRVPLAGKSYRPASNGIQYQWYIRVLDEGGRRPTRRRIEEILALFEAGEEKREPEIRPVDVRVTELEKEVEKQKAISQVLAQRLGAEQVAHRRTQQELQNYRERVNNLEQLLSQKTALAEDIRQHYELTIQQLGQDNERLRHDHQELSQAYRKLSQEFEEYLSTFDVEKQELQNKLAIVEAEKRQLIEQIQEIRRAREVGLEKQGAEYVFRELLGLFLPQVKFLDGSLDTLWREMRDPLDVLRDLTRLGELKAKRVRKAEAWMEKHIDHKWRLYFRKCENSTWQVLIAHKNTQDADIEWLSRQ